MREEESGGGGGGEKKIMQKISSGRSDASFHVDYTHTSRPIRVNSPSLQNSQQLVFGENATSTPPKLSTS